MKRSRFNLGTEGCSTNSSSTRGDIENAKREANATLIIPGANKAATATATKGTERSKHERTPPIPDHDPNSSDGGSIEAEMNKILMSPVMRSFRDGKRMEEK